MPLIACAPFSPSRPFSDSVTSPWTASRPNTRPAIATAIRINGPIENTE